ncbi:ICOS ligand-like [Lagopus leucura]|uniref:ICOS ligand-like n=1 Tax=Lagopus leucura TaxID=30410 RepID=UPI001C676099|nr:ICOS ligand-like [Lagopus leucura]
MRRRGFSYGFLLLFLHILRAVTALEKIISKPGDNVTLSCIYPGREFSLDSLRVYWQIADDEDTEPCSVVHALISGQDNESLQCSQFKNRTQLLWDKLGDGNFSLLLFNVRKSDERTYRCVVMQTIEYTRVIHQEQVVLSLAASYSQPILSGPIRNSNNTGEEVTFICRSDNGYPEPNVYWINRTDNTRLSQSGFNITQHPNGTYSVLSTLKVKATSDMQIECFIENKILQENTSANYKSRPTNDSSTGSHKDPAKSGQGAHAAAVVSVVILMAFLTVLICWLRRRRSSQLVSYTAPI